MRHKPALLIVTVLLLAVSSCRKDPKANLEEKPTVMDCNLNTPTFSVEISASNVFWDVFEDLARNIVLLGKDVVAKYDYKGQLVWSKQITTPGTPQNIIQADGDNYFATSSTMDIGPGEGEGRMLRVTHYWKATIGLNDLTCSPSYELVAKKWGDSADIYYEKSTPPANNSKCFLSKINKNGTLLWTKNFEGNYFPGKSICKTEDGNYFLLTYKLRGIYTKAWFDANEVFQDTVEIPLDEHSLTIYKLDKDGNILWSKTLDGIISAIYYHNEVENGAWIASVQNNAFIQTSRQFFVLDAHGNTMRAMKHYNNTCQGLAYAFNSHNTQVYSRGSISQPIAVNKFLNAYDASGNQTMASPSVHLSGANQIFALSDGFIVANTGYSSGTNIAKTDLTGNLIWNQKGGNIECINQTCKDGIVYVTSKNGTRQLIKRDRNGN